MPSTLRQIKETPTPERISGKRTGPVGGGTPRQPLTINYCLARIFHACAQNGPTPDFSELDGALAAVTVTVRAFVECFG